MKANFKDHSFGGMLGTTVSVKKVRGKMLVTEKLKRKAGIPSDKQAVVRDSFLAASQYANQQVRDPEANALYAKGITDKKRTVYVVAMSDYLNSPEVKAILAKGYKGRVGDTIQVTAKDDFMVNKVFVRITDASGALVEEGEAVRSTLRPFDWDYKAQAENSELTGSTIAVEAYDLPGNLGELSITL